MRSLPGRLATVLAATLVVSGCSADAAAEPSAAPSATSSPVVPDATERPEGSIDVSSIPVASADDIAIPAGLSGDDLATAVVSAFDRWGMAGTTTETVELAITLDVDPDITDFDSDRPDLADFARAIAQAQTPAYAEALYGADWETRIAAQDISMMESYNVNLLIPYVQTALASGIGYEQGNQIVAIDLAGESADGASSFEVRVQPYNNGAESGYGADFEYPEQLWRFAAIESEGRTILAQGIAIVTS
ncbi:hypothetical protein [Agrococcus jejuensis]|uniref:hypothetical protein n=1 Tax=Agrococcus jejuensis TaxID=399736 RepID=UPI00119DABDB|nr:hypothetical protein [Agrococcus jejuensis]